jgi:proteasome lid subunit RPN8/RPN11
MKHPIIKKVKENNPQQHHHQQQYKRHGTSVVSWIHSISFEV